MSEGVTIQDIYDLFKASQERLEASREEFDRRMAEAKAEAKAEADRRAAEAERSMEELRRIVANTSREVGRLGDRWGLFVENLVAPAVLRLFQERGIAIQRTFRRATAPVSGVPMEIDILGVNGDVAVAVEVKSRLAQADIDRFCDKLLSFKQAFPEYASHQLYGAVAAIEFLDTIDRYAYQKGLFVIRQCGDSVEIANDQTFRPRTW
jgi:hypothetical protein